MNFFRRLSHPLTAFIAIQIVWLLGLFFWIRWFMHSHRELQQMASRYSGVIPKGADWLILTEGIVLLVAILAGVYVIFLFWRKQSALLKAKRDFIAQVTHELKSPLASLQLHIETIRRRPPTPARMETFLDTMRADTERLATLVDNLLSANRLEHRGLSLSLRTGDFSTFVSNYFRLHQFSLPRAGNMTLEITPELYTRFEPEALETVFRNLLENAILYSPDALNIRVTLFRDRDFAHLTVADCGRGIATNERKKVFRMFYRGQRSGEAIRGTGLGLFITQAVVRLHKGRVWMESPNEGPGTEVHIRIPLVFPVEKEIPA
jgi:signal transduction histidine kinase